MAKRRINNDIRMGGRWSRFNMCKTLMSGCGKAILEARNARTTEIYIFIEWICCKQASRKRRVKMIRTSLMWFVDFGSIESATKILLYNPSARNAGWWDNSEEYYLVSRIPIVLKTDRSMMIWFESDLSHKAAMCWDDLGQSCCWECRSKECWRV